MNLEWIFFMTPSRVRKSFSKASPYFFVWCTMRTGPVYDGDRFNAVRLFRVISEDSAERDSLDESCAFLIEGAHCHGKRMWTVWFQKARKRLALWDVLEIHSHKQQDGSTCTICLSSSQTCSTVRMRTGLHSQTHARTDSFDQVNELCEQSSMHRPQHQQRHTLSSKSFPPWNTSETQTACSHFPMHTQQGKLSPLGAVPSSITHSQHTPHHQSTNIHLTYYSTSQQISWRKKPSIV